MLPDATRCQIHDLGNRLFDRCGLNLAGVVGIGIDRQGLGHTNGIAQLDRAALGHACRHHVLGQIARRIGRRAVHLGRILARKRTTPMRGSATVSIHDDLATGQTGIAIGATNHESSGRVDPPFGLRREKPLWNHFANVRLDDCADIGAGLCCVAVLGRQDN